MDRLPQELIELILLCNVRLCSSEKNAIAELRCVCKAFDRALRHHVFRTIQMEFSKFLREGAPDLEAMNSVGELCNAIYLDMMVVRDEEEIARLSEVFQAVTTKVPEMEQLIQALRKHCMNDTTFDETDFTRVMNKVLEVTPNLARLRINLPFQVVGRTSSTSTLLLANILACVANRPQEDYKPLEVLVLDHLSDTTVSNLCNNHRDVGNAVVAFSGLRNLVLSIKRQEARNSRQATFTQQLWFLIRKATNLDSLCLIGWNVKRNVTVRRHRHSVGFNDWTMRSLPYISDPSALLHHLRYLELKRVDIDPRSLVDLIRDNSTSLKELYLNEVYIKVFGHDQQALTPLWIGHHNATRPVGGFWVAEELRNMQNLQLSFLRASCLGYDDFEPDRNSTHPDYDLKDPSGKDISFDQRFVEAVLPSSHDNCFVPPTTFPFPHPSFPSKPPPLSVDQTLPVWTSFPRSPISYDVEVFQRHHNSTSHFKQCIDGYFTNRNEQALFELQKIIQVADRGMALISAEIDRSHTAEITEDGTIP